MLKWDWSVQHPLQDPLDAFPQFSPQQPKIRVKPSATIRFLPTAGAFGLVIANNASISGAEGGCQAEVGSASAMSAAALTLAAGELLIKRVRAVCFVIKTCFWAHL